MPTIIIFLFNYVVIRRLEGKIDRLKAKFDRLRMKINDNHQEPKDTLSQGLNSLRYDTACLSRKIWSIDASTKASSGGEALAFWWEVRKVGRSSREDE